MEFLVQGSAASPYKVVFAKRDNNLSASCTCPAGENGLYCKHRISILKGIKTGIVSQNAADVAKVQDWLIGTDVEKMISEVDEKEALLERVKGELATAKKKLAKSMRD